MKRKIFIVCFLMLGVAVFSQNPVLEFDEIEFNFGKIIENGGNVTHVFHFTNTGKGTLMIQNVHPPCNCTTVDWTKRPIEPGAKGSITITYHPAGRPGIFDKYISIYSNATVKECHLRIKGETLMPLSIGDLRLKQRVVQMNNLNKDKSRTRSFDIQNTGNNDLKVSLRNLPAYIKATIIPSVLKPGEGGKISITFDANKCSQWGVVSSDILVVLNDKPKNTSEYQIQVNANIVEDFSRLTKEQKRNAPVFVTNTHKMDIGIIKKGVTKSVKISVSNFGINPLEIRRITSDKLCVKSKENTIAIRRGNSASIYFNINTNELEAGDYDALVNIQTNDPVNSYVTIGLNWSVKK